jgi:hypothetical protein
MLFRRFENHSRGSGSGEVCSLLVQAVCDSRFFGTKVAFVDCVFSGRIEHTVFYGSTPERDHSIRQRSKHEFHGNDFRNAEFIDVGFRGGIDLSLQALPSAPHYLLVPRAADALARIRASVIEWNDLELRRQVLALLKAFDLAVAGGQQQLFIDRRSMPANLRDASEQLFAALREVSESGASR